MNDYLSPQSDSDWEENFSNEEELYLEESSVDDSDLDDALFGIVHTEDLAFSKRKKHFKRKRRAPLYSQKVKSKARKKTAATPSHMSAEIKELMQVVFDAYLDKDFTKAIQVLEEIVRRSPGLHDPLHWLGLIYEKEYNDKQKAINYYFLAAHLVPKDALLWKQIGHMSEEMGNINQAIYCYRRYQRNCTETMDAFTAFRLAKCLGLRGDYKQEILLLRGLFDSHCENCEVTLELCWTYTQLDARREAMQHLETHIKRVEGVKTGVSLHWPCINQLCEYYLKFHYLEKCRDLVKAVCPSFPEKSTFEILLKGVAAEIQLGEYSTAILLQPYLWDASFLSSFPSSSRRKYFLLFGDAYYNRGIFSEALQHFLAICEAPVEGAFENAIWIKMANCYIELRDLVAAAKVLKRCIAMNDASPQRSAGISDAEVRLKCCDVLTALGKIDEADEILVSVSYKDLRETNTLPKAMSTEDREKLLQFLYTELQKFKEETTEETSFEQAQEWKRRKRLWTSQFFCLVEESELDTQRVIRQSYQKKVELSQIASFTTHTEENTKFFPPFFTFPLLASSSFSSSSASFSSAFSSSSSSSSSAFSSLPRISLDEEESSNAAFVENSSNMLVVSSQEGITEKEASTTLFNLQKPSFSSKRKEMPRIVHFSKLKKEMGLHSLEDFLGWRKYAHFLCDAIAIVKECFRLKEVVELLETILTNKKQDRSQLVDPEKRYFKEIVENLSLNLSMEAKLYRITLAHLRLRYMQKPEENPRHLFLFNKILFSGEFAHHCIHSLSTGPEKEILLENRSWIIRQLLQHPYSFNLIVIVGHFCLLSSRWPFAVAEYMRAHRLFPHNALICLSLAAAYISFSTSRSVQNRHAVVLRGFTMLHRYLNLRLNATRMQTMTAARKAFLEAENAYNLARAYHQLSLFYLSIPLYLKCLQILDTVRHCSTKFPLQVDSTTETNNDLIIRSLIMDIHQLTLCSAYNLYIIWKSQRRKTQALWVSNKYLVWL